MISRVPTSAQYQAALHRLEQNGIPAAHITMLQAHYASGKRGLAAEELARSAHYRNHKSVNVQYGTFAGRLARELGVTAHPNLAIVGTWDHEVRNLRGHILFPMRLQLARALESLGWVVEQSAELEMDQEITAIEGRLSLVMIRHRSREARLRKAKIADAIARSSDGRLRCEVPGCGFDFQAVYGKLGRNYAQVHHLAPLGEARRKRVNGLRDLVIVCANCHVMIHRGGKNHPVASLIPKGSDRAIITPAPQEGQRPPKRYTAEE